MSKRSFFSRSTNSKLLELRVQNYHSGKHQKCEIYLKKSHFAALRGDMPHSYPNRALSRLEIGSFKDYISALLHNPMSDLKATYCSAHQGSFTIWAASFVMLLACHHYLVAFEGSHINELFSSASLTLDCTSGRDTHWQLAHNKSRHLSHNQETSWLLILISSQHPYFELMVFAW